MARQEDLELAYRLGQRIGLQKHAGILPSFTLPHGRSHGAIIAPMVALGGLGALLGTRYTDSIAEVPFGAVSGGLGGAALGAVVPEFIPSWSEFWGSDEPRAATNRGGTESTPDRARRLLGDKFQGEDAWSDPNKDIHIPAEPHVEGYEEAMRESEEWEDESKSSPQGNQEPKRKPK